ncbi:MAG: hypothetical protein RI907_2802 [Pseudomonadota bacterium]|jgi:general secretion pathway protein B
MSYILDALKKADQEREQGQVPGLHAHPGQAHDAAPTPGGLSPLVWAGVGVALTLAAVLTWRMWPLQAGPSPAPLTVDAPVVAATPERNSPSGTQAPSPRPTASPKSSHRADGVSMQVDGAPPRSAPGWAGQPALSVPAPKPGERPAPAPTQPDADARPHVILGNVPKLSELPESVRRELPPLQVGGAMHSPNPAQRMLVLNGQVFHEGDSPQSGLKLEEIRLKSAILNFQGQRFELQY